MLLWHKQKDLPGVSLEIGDCVFAAARSGQIVTVLKTKLEHSIEALRFLGIS